MIEFLRLILHIMASFFKPRTKLVAEILVLRQQLNVLLRQLSNRPQPAIPIAFCSFGSIVCDEPCKSPLGAAGLWRGAPATNTFFLCRLLQSGKDAPLGRAVQRTGSL